MFFKLVLFALLVWLLLHIIKTKAKGGTVGEAFSSLGEGISDLVDSISVGGDSCGD